MTPIFHPDGTITRPVRAAGEGIVGDGVETLRPGHPDYAELRALLEGEAMLQAPDPNCGGCSDGIVIELNADEILRNLDAK